MGDLLDQGVSRESIMRQLRFFDDRVKAANLQLHLCLFPPKSPPQPAPRTPEPQRILDIANASPDGGPGYQNAEFTPDPSRADWAYDLVGGHTFTDIDAGTTVWEWTPVFDKTNEYDVQMAGLAGTVIQPGISDRDVPFVHPFGFDWECYISPDTDFESLLAPSNRVPRDQGLANVVSYAREVYGLDAPGVLGLETDSDLVPSAFRPSEGDRIVTYGRWIVDSGHSDFHTEIHPPLLMASAHSMQDGGTASTVISRPYLVSQEFGDGAIRQHLLNEIAKTIPPPFIPFPLSLLFVRSGHMEARPRVLMPFAGNKYMSYVVRPRTKRRDARDKLVASFAFTVRPGVRVWLFDESSDDAVRVLISMDGDQYVPAPLPTRRDWDLSIDDCDKLYPGLGDWIKTGLVGIQLLQAGSPDPAVGTTVAAILDRGIRTTRYDPPRYASPVIATVNAEQLSGTSHFTVDQDQSFPVVGWLTVKWSSAEQQAAQSNCVRLRNALATVNARIDALQQALATTSDKAGLLRQIRSLENQAATLEAEIEKAKCP